MKLYSSLILALLLALLPSQAIASDTVEKTYCTQAIDYKSIDDLKTDLLSNVKRLAVNELFGELIAASTAVENFVVTSDQIRTSSIGFVRIDGNLNFHNGTNLAEVCVTIRAYTTEQDQEKFKPVKLTKRHCVTNGDMTTRQLTTFGKEEAIVQALLDYDRRLEKKDKKDLLSLMQRIFYSESGFISDTETFCARVEGYIVPIEIIALLEPEGITTPASTPVPVVRTCKEILAQNPNAEDGEYTLFVDGQPEKPFTVYCHNMHTTPIEYLPLVNTEGKYNFSRNASGGARPGIDVISQFTKVRIDPLTLIIDPTDLTFAISGGKISYVASNTTYEITTINFATAASCIYLNDSSGTANVDLRGTPFFISDLVAFSLKGWHPAGRAIFSEQRQVVDITGGGHCGENTVSTPLKLEYISSSKQSE